MYSTLGESPLTLLRFMTHSNLFHIPSPTQALHLQHSPVSLSSQPYTPNRYPQIVLGENGENCKAKCSARFPEALFWMERRVWVQVESGVTIKFPRLSWPHPPSELRPQGREGAPPSSTQLFTARQQNEKVTGIEDETHSFFN